MVSSINRQAATLRMERRLMPLMRRRGKAGAREGLAGHRVSQALPVPSTLQKGTLATRDGKRRRRRSPDTKPAPGKRLPLCTSVSPSPACRIRKSQGHSSLDHPRTSDIGSLGVNVGFHWVLESLNIIIHCCLIFLAKLQKNRIPETALSTPKQALGTRFWCRGH